MRRRGLEKRREALVGSGLLALTLVALAFVLAARAERAPPPLPLDAEASAFSASRARLDLDWIARAPHPVGSDEHGLVRARLVERCRELGLEVEEQEAFAAGRSGSLCVVRNVIARRAGRDPEARAVALCAHYDSVPAGPGAGDDAAGVAALLEIARALALEPPLARPVWFVFTDGEEVDLSGARAFVADERLRRGVEVVVNLEARGTGGASRMFETSEGNAELVRAYARSVERTSATSLAYEIYERMPNDTDLSVFKAAGLAGVNFAFIDGFRRYHTPIDDLEHLELGSVQHQGEQALALARELAARTDVDLHAAHDLVYFDGFGLFVTCPRWVAIALSLAALVTVLVVRPRTPAKPRALLSAACVHLVALGTSAFACWALVALFALVRGVPDPWAAEPGTTRAALLAATCLACGGIAATPWARRAGAEALAHSAWIAAALAALVLALWIPGASYLALAPALAGATASFVRSRGALARTVRFGAPACVALLVGAPIVLGLELAFEFHAPTWIGAVAGLLVTCAAPLFAADRIARVSLAIAFLATLGASITALAVSTHTRDLPMRCNLARVEDRERGVASAVVATFGAPLPAELGALAEFEDEPRAALDWTSRAGLGFHADAGACVLEPPQAVRVATEGLRTKVRITSQRGATRFLVLVPRDARVVNARWNEHVMTGGFVPSGLLPVIGVGPEGFELEIEHAAGAAVELRVADVATGTTLALDALVDARPEHASPIGSGDVSIAVTRLAW